MVEEGLGHDTVLVHLIEKPAETLVTRQGDSDLSALVGPKVGFLGPRRPAPRHVRDTLRVVADVAVVRIEEVREVELDVPGTGSRSLSDARVLVVISLERAPGAEERLQRARLADGTVRRQQEQAGIPIAQDPLGDVRGATGPTAREAGEREFDFLIHALVCHHDLIIS